jgi:hypothetical protein
MLDKKHVMLDTETLSIEPTAAIVSLGACKFFFTDEASIVDEFKVNIDAKSCADAGLYIDRNTVDWWWQQPREARLRWQSNPVPLKEALEKFLDWYGTRSLLTWSHGSYFDFPVLENAFKAVGLKRPWKYWDVMDCRTVFNMAGYDNRKAREADTANAHKYHDALEDCKSQVAILRRFVRDEPF